MATLFLHEIPLPELVRRVISYSCVAPRDTKSLSSVGEDENTITLSDLKEKGNAYFIKDNFQRAFETYTYSIKLTDETSSYDLVLSNRASAFITLQKFDDGLRDAENYISYRPKCCKVYAKKAQAWAEKVLGCNLCCSFSIIIIINEISSAALPRLKNCFLLLKAGYKIVIQVSG